MIKHYWIKKLKEEQLVKTKHLDNKWIYKGKFILILKMNLETNDTIEEMKKLEKIFRIHCYLKNFQ